MLCDLFNSGTLDEHHQNRGIGGRWSGQQLYFYYVLPVPASPLALCYATYSPTSTTRQDNSDVHNAYEPGGWGGTAAP